MQQVSANELRGILIASIKDLSRKELLRWISDNEDLKEAVGIALGIDGADIHNLKVGGNND